MRRVLARALRVAWTALVLGAAASAGAGQGTDLGGRYAWRDTADGALAGPGFFDGTVFTETPADDAAPFEVVLPFAFPYYDGSYTSLWVSDNGWVSFQDPGNDARPLAGSTPSPTAPPLMLALYWGDLDCSEPAFGLSIRHGEVRSAGAYRVQYTARDVDSGAPAFLDLYLFQDGRLKFQYRTIPAFGGKTIGIQEASGTDGFAVVDRGAVAPGVPDPPPGDYTIEIVPPPLLFDECGLIPALACGPQVLDESLPGTLPANVAIYGCGEDPWWGRERVHSLELSAATRVQATLTEGTGTDLALHLVSGCSERDCVTGPVTALDLVLGPGSYQLAVDAPLPEDEGSYTLELDCEPLGERIACGDEPSGDTAGGTNLLWRSPCAPGANFSGPERLHTLDLAEPNNLRVELETAVPELDLLLLRVPDGAALTEGECLQWGDETLVLGGLPAGEYVVAVDGRDGLTGSYTLRTSCTVELDCAVAGTADFGLASRQVLSGDTAAGLALADGYSCAPDLLLDGRELVFELILPADGELGVRETVAGSGLSWFVLEDCNEGNCVGDTAGTCPSVLPAGVHRLVVDSPAGAEAPFELELVFSEPQGHWSDCEELQVFPQPDPLPTVLTEWNFSDNAYCHQDPESLNYPDGCSFGMYVAVRCGTSFHVPLHDVESGHVRVFDILRQEYVELTAESTSGWVETGTDISWQDCIGDNPLWNEQTTDVWFENADGLCGVYRLEFPEHSGNVWDLFANCSGDNAPQFPIFDSLCGALEAYQPLPELTLESASLLTDCPSWSASYVVRNDGCVGAAGFAVVLLDDGVPVGEERVASLGPGETFAGGFSGSFPGASSGNVTMVVDFADEVEECSEIPGAGCAGAGQESIRVSDCAAACSASASALALPDTVCPGASVEVDASASVVSGCLAGVPEYRLVGPGGPGPWQPDPLFAIAPGASFDYGVEVRCSDPALSDTCTDATSVSVEVLSLDAAALPTVGESLRVGGPAAYSQSSVPLRWEVAPDLDLAADEHFHVLSSDRPDADFAQVNLPDPPLLSAPLWTDEAADRPDAGTSVVHYLVFAANACHGDNRELDRFGFP